MSEEKMMKWAEGEPWNADVSERYYYTMSRMMDQQVRELSLKSAGPFRARRELFLGSTQISIFPIHVKLKSTFLLPDCCFQA